MKKYLIICCCLLIILKATSQIIVASERMNIVYAGVNNPMQFLANNIDKAKLVVKASCGELIRTAAGKFNWRICNNKYREVIFSVGVIKNKKFSPMTTSVFRIQKTPNPTIHFGSTPESRLQGHPWSHIKHPPIWPTLVLYNFDFDVKFKLYAYDVEIHKLTGDTLRFKNNEAALNENVKKEMANLGVGDKICISNIIYTCGCIEEKMKLDDLSCYVY